MEIYRKCKTKGITDANGVTEACRNTSILA